MKRLLVILCLLVGHSIAVHLPAAAEDDFDPAIISENYEDWVAQELREAIDKKADFKRLMITFNVFSGEADAVAWSYKPTDRLAYEAGGFSYTCDPDPEQTEGFFGTFGLNEDQKEELCDWRLWKYDYSADGTHSKNLFAESLDMAAATAWLKQRRAGMPAIKKTTPILWADHVGFDAAKLEWGATKETRWSAKSCPGITNLLTEIETFPDIAIDLRSFGKTGPKSEIIYDKDASISLSVFTQNGHTIEYPSLSITAHQVSDKIQAIMENCAPDAE